MDTCLAPAADEKNGTDNMSAVLIVFKHWLIPPKKEKIDYLNMLTCGVSDMIKRCTKKKKSKKDKKDKDGKGGKDKE